MDSSSTDALTIRPARLTVVQTGRTPASVVSRPDHVSRFPAVPHYTRPNARDGPELDGADRRARGGCAGTRGMLLDRCERRDAHPHPDGSAPASGDEQR